MLPEKNMPLFVIFGWQLIVIHAKLLGAILAIELANQIVNYGQVFQPFIVNVLLLLLIFGTLTKKVIPSNRQMPSATLRERAVGKETGQTNHIERLNNTFRQRISRLSC